MRCMRSGNLALMQRPAVPDLSAALSDASAEARAAAATSLAEIGAANAAAVPALTKALSDSNPRVRSMAAMALQASGPRAASAVPQLAAALQDPVDSVRHFAADALGAIGPSAASAIPALVERLSVKDERGFVFTSVTTTLGNFGPKAKAALPALEREAKERESAAAQRAILQIEGKPAGDLLLTVTTVEAASLQETFMRCCAQHGHLADGKCSAGCTQPGLAQTMDPSTPRHGTTSRNIRPTAGKRSLFI